MRTADASHWYSYVDPDPKDGINYYRVRQIVNDRIYAQSAIKWALVGKSSAIYVWPNPASDILHVRTPFLKGSMEVIDPGGKLMMRVEITNYIMDLPADRFPGGVYFIQVRSGIQVLKEKFIKI